MKHCLLVLFFFTSLSAHSQSGLDYLISNDFTEAEKLIRAALIDEPEQLEALKAMVIIAELNKNEKDYKEYARKLVSASQDPFYFYLFENFVDDKLIEIHKNLYPSSQLNILSAVADSLFFSRKFEESLNLFEGVTQNLKWSIVGPFKNDAGSGFNIQYWPETEKFDSDRKDSSDVQIIKRWNEEHYPSVDKSVIFDRYLENNSLGNVYYANTFFTIQESQEIDLRLRRNSPIKVWIDGKLIYENAFGSPYRWDSDVITVDLSEGTHRLLIKCASLPFIPTEDFLEFYDRSPGNSTTAEKILGYDFLDIYERLGLKFGIRLTARDKAFAMIELDSYFNAKVNGSLKEMIDTKTFDAFEKWKSFPGNKNLVDLYFLLKALIIDESTKKHEYYIEEFSPNLSDSDLFKYILAKLYVQNNKSEKAYSILSSITDSLSPILNSLQNPIEAAIPPPENQKVIKSNDVRSIRKERKQEYKLAKKELKSKYSLALYETVTDYLVNFGKPNKAIRYYDEIINIELYQPEYRKEKAEIQINAGNYENALLSLKSSIELFPSNPEFYELAGDTYGAIGSKDSAATYYKKALRYMLRSSKSRKYSEVSDKLRDLLNISPDIDRFTSSNSTYLLKTREWTKSYPSSDAIVCFYNKNIFLTTDHIAKVWQEIAIEVRTTAAAEFWKESDFSLFGNLQEYKVIRKDGKELRGEEIDGNLLFKNMIPGDIIYVKGYFEWPLIYDLEGELFLINYLNYDIPSFKTKMEVILPSDKVLHVKNYNLNILPDTINGNAFSHYIWEIDSLKAVRWEDALTDNSDPYATVMISTIENWNPIVQWFNNKVYRPASTEKEIEEIVEKICRSDMSKVQKVEVLHNWIKQEFEYESKSLLRSSYIPASPDLTISRKRGESKDLAALMIALLNEIGVESYYALVKSNNINRQEILPSLMFDEVVLAYRPDQDEEFRYLDLSTKFYPYDVLNENLNHAYALVIMDGVDELIQLPNDYIDPDKNFQELDIQAEIVENGELRLDVKSTSKGMIAGYHRENLNLLSPAFRKSFIIENYGIGLLDNAIVTDLNSGNIGSISKQHIMEFSLFAKEYSQIETLGTIKFRIPFLKSVLQAPAIYEDNRKHKLNLEYLLQIDPCFQRVNIRFPSGYKTIEMPKDFKIESKYGSYKVTYKKTTSGLLVEKEQQFNQMIIEAEEFQGFKDFYMQILEADRKLISIRN